MRSSPGGRRPSARPGSAGCGWRGGSSRPTATAACARPAAAARGAARRSSGRLGGQDRSVHGGFLPRTPDARRNPPPARDSHRRTRPAAPLQILGNEVPPGMDAARPWIQTAAAAASQAGMPCASSAAIRPLSTSPAPAVANQGGALSLIAARPSGAATIVSDPFSTTTAPVTRGCPPRRLQPIRASGSEHPRELAGVGRQHRGATQPLRLACAYRQCIGIHQHLPPGGQQDRQSRPCIVSPEAGTAYPSPRAVRPPATTPAACR